MKAKALILGLALTSLSPAFAAKGGDSGGGGDAMEARVNEIRSDILTWIQKGGAQELTLPADISYGEYTDKMADILANKKVALSFTNDIVKVKNVEKTCRGSFVVTKSFLGEKKTNPQILCNIQRFKDTEESKQYPLIHHEYAGLVNVEKNDGSASDYNISNQITDFLEARTVQKLAVKKKPVKVPSIDPTLEMSIDESSREVTKKEDILPQCLPYVQELEMQQKEYEKIEMSIIERGIKSFYEDNGFAPVTNILLEKKLSAQNKNGIEITYVFNVSAGEDSTKIKLVHEIVGKYETIYRGTLYNYSDKLGRVKRQSIYCSIQLQGVKVKDMNYKYNILGIEAEKITQPNHYAEFTNLANGQKLDIKFEDFPSSNTLGTTLGLFYQSLANTTKNL